MNNVLYPAFYPFLYRYYYGRRIAVIAPLWTDIDLRGTNGVVYFGHVSRSSAEDVVSTRDAEVFNTVKSLVVRYEGDTGFLPTEVVIVTWHNVSLYPSYYYRDDGVRSQ